MSETPAAKHKTARLSVAQFWDRYAGGRMTSMTRDHGTGYTGTFLEYPTRPGEFVLAPEMRFAVKRADLIKYKYKQNPSFSLGIYTDLADALSAVISAPLMNRESIPNTAQLRLVMSVLEQPAAPDGIDYTTLRNRTLKGLKGSEIPLDKVAEMLRALKPTHTDHEEYKMTGEVAKLHAEREVVLKGYALSSTDASIVEALVSVIDNHRYEDATTVDIAIWALGRHNYKKSIEYLTRLLSREELAYHFTTIEHAMQFICSGREMIPLAEEGEASYWRRWQEHLPRNPAAWARHDAVSVYWEKRLRSATEWKAHNEHADLRERLRKDEVLPVRVAAGGAEEIES